MASRQIMTAQLNTCAWNPTQDSINAVSTLPLRNLLQATWDGKPVENIRRTDDILLMCLFLQPYAANLYTFASSRLGGAHKFSASKFAPHTHSHGVRQDLMILA
jgi:hypothetical protein